MVIRAGRLWPPRRVARLDDMPGTGPQCCGPEGVAMRRFAVVVRLGALLIMIAGAATPAPALAARSPHGRLYSMCGSLFGAQQLATINKTTGRADLFGVPVPGLAVMAMAFGRNGTLYAVGDCNPAPVTFECTPGSDPTYNSLYK